MTRNPTRLLSVFWYKWLLVGCLFTFAASLSAQVVTETRWYFGNSTERLQFDRNGRDVTLENDQATPFGAAGASVITDQFSGNLLFYTDGADLFDGRHNLLPTPLDGDNTINVPAVSCPVPGNPGQYFIFTNDPTGTNEVRYTIVDANLPGNGSAQFPLGEVVSANNSLATPLVNPAEGMLIVPNGDGNQFWLITQDRVSFDYRVTSINGPSPGPTSTFPALGSTVDNPGAAAAHFAFNRDSTFLAIAPQLANRNVRLLNFDPVSGLLTENPIGRQNIPNSGFDDGLGEAVYDVAWSPDGSRLYISRFGSAALDANLYQFDLAATTPNLTALISPSIFRSLGLQNAPDGQLYHLYQETGGGPFRLARITNPNELFDSLNYASEVFDVDFGGRQFSSFSAPYNFSFVTLDFEFAEVCFEQTTKFFPLVDPIPESLEWNFGDGATFDGMIANHAFDTAGSFTVNLTATVAGISQTYSEAVQILNNTAQVDLGNDTTICVNEILTLDATTASGISYLWNTGQVTPLIQVDTAGTYWVEVTGPEGCQAYDEIEVNEYGITRQRSNQWYFGEFAGIDFNNGATALTDDNNMFSAEGCATISDIDGNLLFYTNGSTVWNRDHQVMAGGDNIGGDSTSTQSALIVPFEDETTFFYIFTTEEVYGDNSYTGKVSLVDMKGDSARGEVVIKDIGFISASTEKLTGSAQTGAGWLLSHAFGSNEFLAFPISGEGVGNPFFSPVGSIHEATDEIQASGALKFGLGTTYVGTLRPQTGSSELEIFDFDAGAISNPRTVDLLETDPAYGLEFSNDGSRLYVTTRSGNSKLIQYDLDSINATNASADIQATKFDGYPQGNNYGTLQTGPDGVLYMAKDNASSLGTINTPPGDDGGAAFDPDGFDLLTRTSRLGLPNFAQNQVTSPQVAGVEVSPGCLGLPTRFSAAGRDPFIEEFTWNFGDGTPEITGQDTVHTYAAPGTYPVVLTLSNRCDIDTVIFTQVTVNALPEVPTVPFDTALCDGPIQLSAWPIDRPDFSYRWSTGDTSRTITVSQPALLEVFIIDANGCQSETRSTAIVDGRPILELGPDVRYCQDENPSDLDAGNPGASYTWRIDGVVVGNNRTLPIDLDVPGVFEYTAEIIDPITLCVGRDTLEVTVQETPDITASSNPTSDCDQADGSIDITINSTGNFNYSASGPGGYSFGPLNVDVPPSGALPPLVGLEAGAYTISVENMVTGCVRNEVVGVEDATSTINLVATPIDGCPGTSSIDLTFAVASINLEVSDEAGVTQVFNAITSPFTVSNLDPGTFTLLAEDATVAIDPCIEQEIVTVNQLNAQPIVTFDAIQSFCGVTDSIRVTTTDAVNFFWSTPDGNILGLNGDGTAVAVDQSGTYVFIASGVGFCDLRDSIEVQFNTAPTVLIDTLGALCDGQRMLQANLAGGSGPFTYLWNTGQQGPQITIEETGIYFVTVRDQATGCAVSSADVSVGVADEIEVVISAAPDCEDEGSVFLEAVVTTDAPEVVYQWTNASGQVVGTDPVISVDDEGPYTVAVNNLSGTCRVTDVFDVILTPITEDDFLLPPRTSFCSLDPEDPTVDLDPGVFNSYEWTLVPNPAVISTDRVLNVAATGTYEVTVFNGFTCATFQVVVRDDCTPSVVAPNAFTPNGDGLNDVFSVIPNPAVRDFEIVIFNRWGEPVFKSNSMNFAWEGTRNGTILPPGAYTYVMRFSSTLDSTIGQQEQFGSITLIR